MYEGLHVASLEEEVDQVLHAASLEEEVDQGLHAASLEEEVDQRLRVASLEEEVYEGLLCVAVRMISQEGLMVGGTIALGDAVGKRLGAQQNVMQAGAYSGSHSAAYMTKQRGLLPRLHHPRWTLRLRRCP